MAGAVVLPRCLMLLLVCKNGRRAISFGNGKFPNGVGSDICNVQRITFGAQINTMRSVTKTSDPPGAEQFALLPMVKLSCCARSPTVPSLSTRNTSPDAPPTLYRCELDKAT